MDVKKIFRRDKAEGLVGIEIEVEGENLPQAIAGWKREHDGSLRGESAEYVLRKPATLKRVTPLLNLVTAAYKDCNSVIADSERTSVHIHINVQELTMTQVFNFITLYAAFEESLLRFCGESRIGNLFCLRIRDAEYLPIALEQAVRTINLNTFANDHLRYAAINVTALAKFGSLEFRSMRGTEDMKVVGQWINLLVSLKKAAVSYESPIEIVQQISIQGEAAFAAETFGEHRELLEILPYEVMDGVRYMQDCAFSTDWVEFEKNIKRRYEG